MTKKKHPVNQWQKSHGRLDLNEKDKRRIKEKAEAVAATTYVDLHSKGSRYSDEQKLYAITTWLLTRNLEETANYTGIPEHTLKTWKYHKDGWWDSACKAIMALKNDELDYRLTDMIDVAADSLFDRLQNGEDHVLRDGKIIKKGVSARDLMVILGTTYDKRALMRGDPTSRTEKKDTDEKLNKLTNAFQSIAKNDMKLINGEVREPSNVENEEVIDHAQEDARWSSPGETGEEQESEGEGVQEGSEPQEGQSEGQEQESETAPEEEILTKENSNG